MPKPIRFAAMIVLCTIASTASAGEPSPAEKEFVTLQEAYLARYKPLLVESKRAWWEANTTGDDKAFARRKKADTALIELHADRDTFAKLKTLRDSEAVQDPVLRRTLDVMYRAFLPAQADSALQKRIVSLESEVEQLFNVHRSLIDGQPRTENDVREILGQTTDSAKAKEAWTAYIDVGRKVEAPLRELITLRNRLATQLGFSDFHAYRLFSDEIDDAEFVRLFDELDDITREPYRKLKERIDAQRAGRFGISPDQLRPWHYHDLFFQEAPGGGEVNLDAVYEDQDLVALTRDYYVSLGMEVDDILARSDLYEKPGKSPHAFCEDIDREGDIRVLCNLKQNLYWMDTMLHELGHGVYDQYIRQDVPFLLHAASHAITTEGFANLIGAMSKNPEFLTRVRKLSPDEADRIGRAAREALRDEKIIFSRWTQVMMRFERGMYKNPDQDLARLWWDLKKEYQLLNPPDDLSLPGYGAKIHVVTVPVYYHSYMMGDLFACQVAHYATADVMGGGDPRMTCFFGRKDVGNYFRAKIMGPGDLMSWNELTRHATGEPLTAKYFASQYLE